MTDTQPDETWIRAGATVAVDSTGSGIAFATIARLLTQHVVLDDGSKFRRYGFHTKVGTTGRHAGRIVDPHEKYVVDAYARQQLRGLVAEADRLTHGSGATIHGMDATAVRAALDDLADKLNAARKEVDRRAGL